MNTIIKHDKYKNELEESILKEFMKAICNYQKSNPPEPDFFCASINTYIEVTTCAYDKIIGQDTHMLQQGKIDSNSFNSRQTAICNIDHKLENAILDLIGEKSKINYETKGRPVWLIIYADCPLHDQKEIEGLNINIKQDKFKKIFILYKQSLPLRGFGIYELTN